MRNVHAWGPSELTGSIVPTYAWPKSWMRPTNAMQDGLTERLPPAELAFQDQPSSAQNFSAHAHSEPQVELGRLAPAQA